MQNALGIANTTIADALEDDNLYLTITPGAHCHFGNGGGASLDRTEKVPSQQQEN